MKFEHTEVWGFEHALRGMRNPMNSWDKSDSRWEYNHFPYPVYVIGENDMKLAKSLIKAGSEHRKFLRQIFVSVDITAPLYFWSEFDTYKVGTVANSTSKMHKLAATPITLDCFETDDYCELPATEWGETIHDNFIKFSLIPYLEKLRQKFVETNDKKVWKELIRWLPESWLQTRTITMNYENIYAIVRQRQNHKLSEWAIFIKWAHTLPYSKEFVFYE